MYNVLHLNKVFVLKISDNPCYPNPCNNGGTCLVFYTVYLCKCSRAYRGTRCNGKNALGPLLFEDKSIPYLGSHWT